MNSQGDGCWGGRKSLLSLFFGRLGFRIPNNSIVFMFRSTSEGKKVERKVCIIHFYEIFSFYFRRTRKIVSFDGLPDDRRKSSDLFKRPDEFRENFKSFMLKWKWNWTFLFLPSEYIKANLVVNDGWKEKCSSNKKVTLLLAWSDSCRVERRVESSPAQKSSESISSKYSFSSSFRQKFCVYIKQNQLLQQVSLSLLHKNEKDEEGKKMKPK